MLGAFATMGADATQAAQAKAQRLTVANDVTFAVMSDPEASAQWRPDLFPLPIEPHEWSGIERGVHELSDHIAERFFSHSSPTSVGGAGSGGS